jgi:hypothetical protein
MSLTTRWTLDPRCGRLILPSVVYPAKPMAWSKTEAGVVLPLVSAAPRKTPDTGGINNPGDDMGGKRTGRSAGLAGFRGGLGVVLLEVASAGFGGTASSTTAATASSSPASSLSTTMALTSLSFSSMASVLSVDVRPNNDFLGARLSLTLFLDGRDLAGMDLDTMALAGDGSAVE